MSIFIIPFLLIAMSTNIFSSNNCSPGHLAVMLAIGNSLANSVWESNTRGRVKPTPQSTREEKESWIRNKYEGKDFLPALSCNATQTIGQQLIEAVVR